MIVQQGGIVDEIITKVGHAIRDFLGSIFTISWVPEVVWWYWWLFVFAIACGFIIFYFGWSVVVRKVVSFALLVAAIFVAGGAYMNSRLKKRAAAKEARDNPEPDPQPPVQKEPWRVKMPWE